MVKHYGGDDLNEMFYRLLKRREALHHFPQDVIFPQEYPYHQLLLE